MEKDQHVTNFSALYIYPKEIREILGVKEAKSYRIIKELNKELNDMGYMTVRGKVSRKYFMKRFGLEKEADNE